MLNFDEYTQYVSTVQNYLAERFTKKIENICV